MFCFGLRADDILQEHGKASAPSCQELPADLTQAVEAERPVVEEVADVSRLRGHGAEGVGAAGREGVNADEQHVHQQGPGVAVGHEVQAGAEDAETPQEVPAKQQQQQKKMSRITAIVWISTAGLNHQKKTFGRPV